MPAENDRPSLNGDHDPDAFAVCPRCRQATFCTSIPTSGGDAIVYVCDACDASGPRIYIPHIERFERRSQEELVDPQRVDGLLKLVKGARARE